METTAVATGDRPDVPAGMSVLTTVGSSVLAGVGLFCSYAAGASHFWLAYTCLVVGGGCIFAPYGPFFAIVPEMLPSSVAGEVMALVNSGGALGGFAQISSSRHFTLLDPPFKTRILMIGPRCGGHLEAAEKIQYPPLPLVAVQFPPWVESARAAVCDRRRAGGLKIRRRLQACPTAWADFVQ